MPCWMCVIGCVWKTPFRKSGYIYIIYIILLLAQQVTAPTPPPNYEEKKDLVYRYVTSYNVL